ncbi:MAG: sugar ABC transporter substrate-binding protein [Treponema sp.]|jgi:ribose transport system substrate-binding protein|nr:sugar ABC transporter substrate-binding protein [Treponema sp.]
MMKRFTVVLMLPVLMLTMFSCSKKESTGSTGGEAVSEAEKYVVGFANIAESNQVAIDLGDCIVEECGKLGMEVIRVNNNFDGATAVKNVDDLLTMEIDALIEFNVDQSVAPVIMEKCNAAGIPVFAIDIAHPGATFFGADNQYAGEIAGEYMGQLAKELWNGQIDALLLVDQMASGELPRKRILGSIPGIQKVIPGFTEDKVFFVEGKQDAGTAQQVVSDFLSAHPDWHHILICALHDDGFRGACAAVQVAGRQNDVLAVGQNESFFVEYARANPKEDFVRGAVGFFLTSYGKWLAPAVKDKLDGKQVPENVYVEHVVVTRANLDELGL